MIDLTVTLMGCLSPGEFRSVEYMYTARIVLFPCWEGKKTLEFREEYSTLLTVRVLYCITLLA